MEDPRWTIYAIYIAFEGGGLRPEMGNFSPSDHECVFTPKKNKMSFVHTVIFTFSFSNFPLLFFNNFTLHINRDKFEKETLPRP